MLLVFGFSYEIRRKRSIVLCGITYTDTWEAEEPIGIFKFDRIIYKHRWGEFLAIKRLKWEKCREDLVKIAYLNVIADDYSGVWAWLLTENWSESEVKELEKDKDKLEEVLDRFRERMREYKRNHEEELYRARFTKKDKVRDLYFKIVERMNAPNGYIVSNEPIERYFRMLPIIIDIG